LFLVQCCGVRQWPKRPRQTQKFWKGENNIDQQSWPMLETVALI